MGKPRPKRIEKVTTEKLGIENTGEQNRPYSIPVSNISRKFDGVLVQWWEHFGLAGDGLIIGDGGYAPQVKKALTEHHPEINSIQVVDLHDADIIWDICTPPPLGLYLGYDWVISQAVLEHVYAPFLAVKYMAECLKPDGLLYLHTVGPNMKEHRHPTDCVRFLRDFFIEAESKLPIELVDLLVTRYHVNALYGRR